MFEKYVIVSSLVGSKKKKKSVKQNKDVEKKKNIEKRKKSVKYVKMKNCTHNVIKHDVKENFTSIFDDFEEEDDIDERAAKRAKVVKKIDWS